jgi:type I restriction-modification system DNA methylase subunit
MFGFFGTNRKIERVEEEVRRSFENTRKDLTKVGSWIGHLDEKSTKNDSEIELLKEQLNLALEDIEDLKEAIALFGGKLSKRTQTVVHKQTGFVDVQTPVQTAVQTSILDNLTISERSIILALLYSDMKLSYEDLAVMLGKDKSTIRGQINVIKQKSESLIKEYREPSGKKRVYIPEEIVRLITKSVKVRVKKKEKVEKEV